MPPIMYSMSARAALRRQSSWQEDVTRAWQMSSQLKTEKECTGVGFPLEMHHIRISGTWATRSTYKRWGTKPDAKSNRNIGSRSEGI